MSDAFGQRGVGVAVRVEKRSGRRWRTAQSGRTGAGGSYSLRTRGSGTYVIVATLAGVSARSTAVWSSR